MYSTYINVMWFRHKVYPNTMEDIFDTFILSELSQNVLLLFKQTAASN